MNGSSPVDATTMHKLQNLARKMFEQNKKEMFGLLSRHKIYCFFWIYSFGYTWPGRREKQLVGHTLHQRKPKSGQKPIDIFIKLFSSTLSHLIYPLTARVVGEPQMISQPISSVFLCLHCPLGLAKLQACPFPGVAFPHLPLSTLSSFPFHCALQDGFGQT